jgi:O-antigen ligase
LAVLSLFWTIDLSASIQSLSKQSAFILIPFIFYIHPLKTEVQKQKVLRFFSYGMLLFCVFYLLRASVRYLFYENSAVFFYHDLVSQDVNAIYVSVYLTVAFFVFYSNLKKTKLNSFAQLIMFVTLVLLSSKNLILVFFILLFIAQFIFLKTKIKQKAFLFISALLLSISVVFFNKISDRFLIEIESNSVGNSINKEAQKSGFTVYNVSISRAWNARRFEPYDYFTGTSLRVYQLRIFIEIMTENNKWLTGFGTNATDIKIAQKAKHYNLDQGYGTFNFHNQYVQTFAELGVFGFLTLIVMLVINLKNAIHNKDFIQFSFAVVMISLFLSESFFSRVRGVVFFSLLFCIFNQFNKHKKTN